MMIKQHQRVLRKLKTRQKSLTDYFKNIEIIKWEEEVLKLDKEHHLEVK